MLKLKINGVKIAVVLFLFTLLFYCLVNYNRNRFSTKVLLNVRTLNQHGHPLAGVNLHCDNKYCGTTDSFGEWSQLRSVFLGESILINAQRRGKHETLSGYKEIEIPIQVIADRTLSINSHMKLHKRSATQEFNAPLPQKPSFFLARLFFDRKDTFESIYNTLKVYFR